MEHKFSKIRSSLIAHRSSLIAANESRPCRREIYFPAAFLRPFLLLLFPALLLGCDPPSGSGGGSAPPAPPKNLQSILQSGTLPRKLELAAYDKVTAGILENLAGDTAKELGIIYVTPDGGSTTKDGSSWEKAHAAAGLKTAIDNAGTASSKQKPYLVMVAEGSYAISETLSMKNHVAIIGGFSGNGWEGTTTLDGGGSAGTTNGTRVFSNTELDNTAVLSGVTISKGFTNLNGGGMLNTNSSPTLSHVTFSENIADQFGGGMHNDASSPTLSHVTFSKNTAPTSGGGGMANTKASSPTLTNVTFSGNRTYNEGGGMFNSGNSSPALTNAEFSENKADYAGGGMSNSNSSPTLTNVTFSGNTAVADGGGMRNTYNSSSTLTNVTFSKNTAEDGGGMANNKSSPALINVTFSENTAPNGSGGGMHNKLDPNSQSRPFVVNSIFWGNTDSQGNTGESQITGMNLLEISDSIVQRHADPDLGLSDGDPQLKALQDNGGFVQTRALPSGSPAINKGSFIRKHGVRIYRKDGTSTQWRSFDTSNGSRSNEEPPSEAIDLTATDARGYARTGRPDLGAFEFGGTAP